MPKMKRCADRMCRALVTPNEQYCTKHQHQPQRHTTHQSTQDRLRQQGSNRAYNIFDRSQEANAFYQSKQWQTMRNMIISRDMNTCQVCGNVTEDRKAVDHLVAYKIDHSKALEPTNLWTLCYKCHRAKTLLEQQILASSNGVNKAKHCSRAWYIRAIRQLNNKS